MSVAFFHTNNNLTVKLTTFDFVKNTCDDSAKVICNVFLFAIIKFQISFGQTEILCSDYVNAQVNLINQ